MKKLFPVILFVLITAVGYKLLSAGTLSPVSFAAISGALMIGMAFLRPKNAVTAKVNPETITDALGEYAKDAFSDDSKESALFHSAVKDFTANMPKAAIAKLEKLAPQCRDDVERYAIAIICALAYIKLNKYENAILEYNRAVVIHPTSKLAYTIGTNYQRMGELKKARESYDFALDLDPSNIEARASMATAFVASRKYEQALEQAEMALEMDENFSSALATCAICYGITGNDTLYHDYTQRAVQNGYSEEKIRNTVKALKK